MYAVCVSETVGLWMKKRDNLQNHQVPDARDDGTQDRMNGGTRQDEVPDVRHDKTRDRTNENANQNEGELTADCDNSAGVITYHVITFIVSMLAFYGVCVGGD